MRTYSFRSVDEWKSSLMILPDSSFYELLRSVFGNIKTPFNKQRLMDDLFVLLSRNDIRKTIAAYINQEDHKLIAAISLLEDPTPEELGDFFQGDLRPASLLFNLEERLILFRFQDEAQGSKRRLALNPVLEPVLAPFAADNGILFPCADRTAKAESQYHERSITDNRFLMALVSFISGEEEFYKVEGIRKKVLDNGKRLFPDLDLELTARVLEQLGLFFSQGEKLLPDPVKIRDFGALSPQNRREYWASGLYHQFSQDDSSGDYGFPRSRVRNLALLIHRFCGLIDPEKQYPELTLLRWVKLLEREDSQNPWRQKIQFGILLKAMELAGILSPEWGDESMRVIIPVVEAENSSALIAMDSAFSFIMYPGISYDHVMKLAAFSSLREDSPFGFELSRLSVVRGFNQGLKAEDMLNLLKELSGDRIDESLEWSIMDWENRYSAVSLYEGLILSLSEDRRYLIETEPMASLVQKTLAPGIYLLSGESHKAAEILQKAGVDIIAQPKQGLLEAPGMSRTFPPLEIYRQKETSGFRDSSSYAESSLEAVKEHFRQHLKGLNLSKTEKDELLNRIERRVIFTETQLEKASIKFEKLEARLLDFPGKTAIAKQAIADASFVEVFWPGPEGKTSSSFGTLQALDKKEGETVLVLKPLLETDISGDTDSIPRDIIRIPLGKISLLRRIKKSYFEK